MNRRSEFAVGVFFITCALVIANAWAEGDSYAGRPVVMNMMPLAQGIQSRDPNIDYNIDPARERFFVDVPAQYTGDEAYGLIIFTDPENEMNQLPDGWLDVLARRKLIFIAPFNAGNDQPTNRRHGLSVYAALCAERHWKIDPHRIYAAGFSGGARIAGDLGFYANDIFAGSIQMCGADFYKDVPQVLGNPTPDDKTPYGMLLKGATQSEIRGAKNHFRFVFVTGERDFRHGSIVDIFNGGYAKEGFQSTLIDAPMMGHEVCTPKRLNQAIDFIENVKPAPTSQPTPPAWMAKDPTAWPEILLRNELTYKDNGVAYAGSSSLFRLPGGVVVMGTAGHVIQDVKLADFATGFKSWISYPQSSTPARGVHMTRIALDAAHPPEVDLLVLCPQSQHEQWPSTVLPIRQEPLELGDVVYLIAVPFDSKSNHQIVYKGVVARHVPDNEIQYDVDGSFDTTGCSGAPVIDEYGQLAGINIAHLVDQAIPGTKQLILIEGAEVLKNISLPADVKPAPIAVASSRPSSPAPSDKPADPAEQKAEFALRNVQVYIDNKMYDQARAKLQAIVQVYPATEAAKKATQLLAQLPNP